MEIISIILATYDQDYAKALTKCITEDNPNLVFKLLQPEELCELNSFDGIDIILSDKVLDIKSDYLMLLEKRSDCNKDDLKKITLYKYDTAENIYNAIILEYCMKTGYRLFRPMLKKSQTILFCSAEGGTGKTSVALGLAQELTRYHGKKVLYISYEEFESTNSYFKESKEKSITNYLYYIYKNKKNIAPVDSFTVSDDYGVKSFSSLGGRNQLKLLNVEELSDLFNIIQENGDFDYIFIDNDTSLKEENLWLFSICDKICKIEKWGNKTKEESFIKYLKHSLGDHIFDKMITVINFFDSDECSTENMGKIFIEKDDESFSLCKNEEGNEIININIDQEFGMGIKELSTKLTLNLQ